MVRYLIDPANAITTVGILLSTIGLHFAVLGRPELAVAIVLWAMLADQLDGVVAKHTPNRSGDFAKMGKSLDGFADLLYGAAFPAVIVLKASASYLSLFAAVGVLISGTVRLSYFNNFGLSKDECFMGVPLSYDVPLLAVLFLVRPWLEVGAFAIILNVSLLLLSALHVAPIRVPAPNKVMYAFIALFSIAASVALVRWGET
ncbi:CDP-alcohol phosphatidyltransferase family protein [Bradyrhizobium diazoefficiens]|uniref:CDP-alcohol phosphatidyltransferase family protein n=1 Tax=Bradyrhizobium diazoefficiens TaxID=1355477 RepID=UPI00190DAA48|nr:CDP-alcohol phosphatidyltransferase family protein [Bradyrhizobium diazoefficiens]QQO35639.1 CDP-alcohol phosphatidyltransferase family protein [Bradyrhizobium diazoefficiens]